VREEDILKHRRDNTKQTSSNKKYYSPNDLLTMEIGLPKYTRNIVREFYHYAKPEINSKDFKIADFGAGTGALAQIWIDDYSVTPDCVEIDPELISILKKKRLNVIPNLNATNEKFTFVYTSNVLEHIKDDSEALNDLFQKIAYNGKLAIYVPAFPVLFSSLDYKVGHFRRYTKKELKDKVISAGFEVVEIRFCDSLGFFGTLILKILKIDTGKALSSPGFLKFHDTIFHPTSLLLDKLGLDKVVGKNILLFATKK
jgi:ubiquinone/menaquinone biosynthesis C-methylase UbiE